MKGCDNRPFEAGMVEGANLERRRIRRALTGLLFVLRTASEFSGIQAETCASAYKAIDAATRARKGRGR